MLSNLKSIGTGRLFSRLFYASVLVIVVLAVLAWGLDQKAKRLAGIAASTGEQLVIANGLLQAVKARDKRVAVLQKQLEETRNEVRQIDDDGCLDRRLPDDALRLLNRPG